MSGLRLACTYRAIIGIFEHVSAVSSPSICIVSPSYNQRRYVVEMLDSLRRQEYPNLDHLILDAGSVDGTIDEIRRNKPDFSKLVVEQDGGPAQAINKGLDACQSELFNWLNTDDYLFDSTLRCLGTIYEKWPSFDIYAFCGAFQSECGRMGTGLPHWRNVRAELARGSIGFAQEGTFLRTEFLKRHKIRLNEALRNMFDTLLYQEMLAKGARVLFINAFGGVIRMHRGTLTANGIPAQDRAIARMHAKEWTSWPQRGYQRISATRLGPLLSIMHRSRSLSDLFASTLRLGANEYAVCNMVGFRGDCSEGWELAPNDLRLIGKRGAA